MLRVGRETRLFRGSDGWTSYEIPASVKDEDIPVFMEWLEAERSKARQGGLIEGSLYGFLFCVSVVVLFQEILPFIVRVLRRFF